MPVRRKSVRTGVKGEQAVQRGSKNEAFHEDAVPCRSDDKHCCDHGWDESGEGLVRIRLASAVQQCRGFTKANAWRLLRRLQLLTRLAVAKWYAAKSLP